MAGAGQWSSERSAARVKLLEANLPLGLATGQPRERWAPLRILTAPHRTRALANVANECGWEADERSPILGREGPQVVEPPAAPVALGRMAREDGACLVEANDPSVPWAPDVAPARVPADAGEPIDPIGRAGGRGR